MPGAVALLQLSKDDKLIGLVPHFTGPSRMRVALTELIEREDATPLDAAFHAWAGPEPGDEHRAYLFVFDCPNPRAHADLRCPAIATVQVAAFAHEIELFPSVEIFEAAQAEREVKFALPSFIPAGLFSADGMSMRAAESIAVMTGVVKETATRHNDLTGNAFHWARIQSLAGEYDVVVDPALAPEPPQVGGVATGLFWLSARFVDYAKGRGFLRSRARRGLVPRALATPATVTKSGQCPLAWDRHASAQHALGQLWFERDPVVRSCIAGPVRTKSHGWSVG